MTPRSRTFRRAAQAALGALVAAVLLAGMTRPAGADDDGDDDHGTRRGRAATPAVRLLPLYTQECASCHLAYPPGFLPAASWQRMMNQLPTHFGTDASLEPAQVRTLTQWLTAHAATTGRRADAPPEDRITRSRWFLREHDDIRPAVWARPAVRSPANCMACHTRAHEGLFDEHDIRIPR